MSTPNPIEIRICPKCAGRAVLPRGGFHYRRSVRCTTCNGYGDMEFHTATQQYAPKPVYQPEPVFYFGL